MRIISNWLSILGEDSTKADVRAVALDGDFFADVKITQNRCLSD